MASAPECICKVMKEKQLWEIVEVGVNSCSFCDQLLELLRLARHDLVGYYLVDPWPHGYTCGSCGPGVTPDHWDRLYAAACKRTTKHFPLKVMRLSSLEAAKCFENGSLCCVYIDADHTYESIMADCAAWLPKIRRGGVICGHDYSGGWKEVVRGVDEFFTKRSGLDVQHFFEVGDGHYRMESGVWVVEL